MMTFWEKLLKPASFRLTAFSLALHSSVTFRSGCTSLPVQIHDPLSNNKTFFECCTWLLMKDWKQLGVPPPGLVPPTSCTFLTSLQAPLRSQHQILIQFMAESEGWFVVLIVRHTSFVVATGSARYDLETWKSAAAVTRTRCSPRHNFFHKRVFPTCSFTNFQQKKNN